MESKIKPIKRPQNIPASSKLMQGVGASSWFYTEEIDIKEKLYRFVRYSPEGELECNRIMELSGTLKFDINQEFEFTYISHCLKCTITQNNHTFEFIYKP